MDTAGLLRGMAASLPTPPGPPPGPPLPQLPSAAPTESPAGPGFGQLVTDFVNDVNRQQLDSDAAVEALATGRAENVHEVVLTAIKADLSVRMLFEIRNQLVESYQEVMRMQL